MGGDVSPNKAAIYLTKLAINLDPVVGMIAGDSTPTKPLQHAASEAYDRMTARDRRRLIALLAWTARAFAFQLPEEQRKRTLAALTELSRIEG